MPPAELATPRRRLKISAMVLLGLMVVGATGFYIIGVASGKDRGVFDSIYLTAVVLSTVGAWHRPMELNSAEEIWIVLLIVFGIGTAAFAISNVMALAFGGEFQRILGRRQLTGKINQLLDHYIVCGFGRMGRSICQTLARDGVNFITIDKSTDKTTQADELGYLYVLGDAADEDILKMAGI
ncbi:MAG: NAD-binding protein, partial [Phycisphaeraceae bacterium]|nr:NAD-binding protein [Phycisphaeraceae bacterium]